MIKKRSDGLSLTLTILQSADIRQADGDRIAYVRAYANRGIFLGLLQRCFESTPFSLI